MDLGRFKIANLLAFVVAAAVVFAGLRSGSNDWFKCIYTATFLVMVYAAIAARYRAAFWHGFAVAGWAYFIIGFGQWIDTSSGSPHQNAVNRNIVTSVVVEIVVGVASRQEATSTTVLTPANVMKMRVIQANRNGICHSALALLFAFAGGLVSEAVARRSSSGRPG